MAVATATFFKCYVQKCIHIWPSFFNSSLLSVLLLFTAASVHEEPQPIQTTEATNLIVAKRQNALVKYDALYPITSY